MRQLSLLSDGGRGFDDADFRGRAMMITPSITPLMLSLPITPFSPIDEGRLC